jgi:hypothetical protein
MAPAGGVFIIPGTFVKNGDGRLSVLNRIAKSVVEAHRGISRAYVFTVSTRDDLVLAV